jgi:hypothetical protein
MGRGFSRRGAPGSLDCLSTPSFVSAAGAGSGSRWEAWSGLTPVATVERFRIRRQTAAAVWLARRRQAGLQLPVERPFLGNLGSDLKGDGSSLTSGYLRLAGRFGRQRRV